MGISFDVTSHPPPLPPSRQTSRTEKTTEYSRNLLSPDEGSCVRDSTRNDEQPLVMDASAICSNQQQHAHHQQGQQEVVERSLACEAVKSSVQGLRHFRRETQITARARHNGEKQLANLLTTWITNKNFDELGIVTYKEQVAPRLQRPVSHSAPSTLTPHLWRGRKR